MIKKIKEKISKIKASYFVTGVMTVIGIYGFCDDTLGLIQLMVDIVKQLVMQRG